MSYFNPELINGKYINLSCSKIKGVYFTDRDSTLNAEFYFSYLHGDVTPYY